MKLNWELVLKFKTKNELDNYCNSKLISYSIKKSNNIGCSICKTKHKMRCQYAECNNIQCNIHESSVSTSVFSCVFYVYKSRKRN